MDKLQKCAKAFENLLEIQYRIIIGRKGKTVELVIGFSKLDFHHLMGLGKLKDLRIAKQNRGSVFDEIITGITTYETLTKSRYLAQIENRFEPLALVEQLLDDNRLVFRYNTKLNQFSLIEADYLLSTPFENSDIYIFIAEHKDTGKYFCRSFFPKEKKDYTEGQPRYTMLYKEKRNMATGEIAVQYDRLTPKKSTVISKKGVLIMQPISVEKFADMVMKNNKGYHKKELVKTLRETLAAKKNGARCMVCGAPIWAAGSAITGSNLCFTCTTGEADDSEDYEIE